METYDSIREIRYASAIGVDIGKNKIISSLPDIPLDTMFAIRISDGIYMGKNGKSTHLRNLKEIAWNRYWLEVNERANRIHYGVGGQPGIPVTIVGFEEVLEEFFTKYPIDDSPTVGVKEFPRSEDLSEFLIVTRNMTKEERTDVLSGLEQFLQELNL